jgi:hypothetical protein
MASLFASLERVAGATVDAVMAEEFDLIPRLKAGGDVNARASTDTARLAYPFQGIFSCDGRAMHAPGRAMADNTTTAMAAAPPTVDAFASAFPQRPEIDWHVRRSATLERFRIAEVIEREGGRLILSLVRQS